MFKDTLEQGVSRGYQKSSSQTCRLRLLKLGKTRVALELLAHHKSFVSTSGPSRAACSGLATTQPGVSLVPSSSLICDQIPESPVLGSPSFVDPWPRTGFSVWLTGPGRLFGIP